MKAVGMLSTPILNLVRDQLADCIVVDFLHPWAANVAFEGNIPLIMFNPWSLFHVCCEDSLNRFKPHENVNVGSDWEPFLLPGLPDHVELTRSRLPDHFRGPVIVGKDFISSFKHAMDTCYCLMVNSSCEFESKYVHYYNNVVGRKCCLVAPPHCYPVPKDDNIFE
ncbi:putative UDP-glucosyl transferase 73B6 [Silene latifolia]|uniref:putative UDP-glucosyl transferase 73B6 n=1 Tax=Silene latifolia TaxID=37657 RepID=UPI003D779D25